MHGLCSACLICKTKLLLQWVKKMKTAFLQRINFFGHRLNIAAVCGAVLVLLAGIYGFMRFNLPDQNALSLEALKISRDIRSAFSLKPDYRGLNSAYVIQNKIILPSLVRQNKIFSRFQSEIVIGRDDKGNASMAGDYYFDVTYQNLNRRKCKALMTAPFMADSGLIGIELKNEKAYHFTYGGEYTLPVSKQNADTLCKAKNSITLSFE